VFSCQQARTGCANFRRTHSYQLATTKTHFHVGVLAHHVIRHAIDSLPYPRFVCVGHPHPSSEFHNPAIVRVITSPMTSAASTFRKREILSPISLHEKCPVTGCSGGAFHPRKHARSERFFLRVPRFSSGEVAFRKMHPLVWPAIP